MFLELAESGSVKTLVQPRVSISQAGIELRSVSFPKPSLLLFPSHKPSSPGPKPSSSSPKPSLHPLTLVPSSLQASSEQSICFAVKKEDGDQAVKVLEARCGEGGGG